MKTNDALFIVVALAIVFLLQGEPSLWDVLHQRAMSAAECVK